MQKAELRKQIRLNKQQYGQAELAVLSEAVRRRLQSHPLYQRAAPLLLFSPLPDEPDIRGVIDEAAMTRRVLLPVVTGSESMELREYRGPERMSRGAFGILEPEGKAFTDYASIDLAVIPGVAFDAAGHRLGRGRGYYDRLLAAMAPFAVPTLGLCFDFQKLPAIPVEPHDIPVDEVL